MQLSTVVGGADSNIEPGICYKKASGLTEAFLFTEN